MRWFFDLSYLGAPFHGWQVQPGVVTVQSTVEEALGRLMRQPVAVTGAGRTDAGVNARRMIAHADLPDGFDASAPAFLRSLNAMCGPHIAIAGARPVAPGAHARFDATGRTYRYFAHTFKSPFMGRLSWQAPASLDFDAMNDAAALLLGRRDFTSFSKLHTDVRTNICDLRAAAWHETDTPGCRYFEISADRFLRNMVRAVVGTLVEVGRGKLSPSGLMEVLEARDRCAAGTSMPAEPLFLWDVTYPY